MHYDLWDVETGNYFGRFAREEEALDVVRTLVTHYGSEYADRLSLGAEDEDGTWFQPLEGAALLARIETRAPASPVRRLEKAQNGATDAAVERDENVITRPKSA